MLSDFLSQVPEHRDLTRYEIFHQHLSSSHNCNLYFELQDGEIVLVAGLDRARMKPLKWSSLANIAETLAVKLGNITFEGTLHTDPEVNFVFLGE